MPQQTMIYVYTVIISFLIFISLKVDKNIFNMVTILNTLFLISVVTYEIGLIKYYPLTVETYLVLIIFQITFSVSFLLAYKLTNSHSVFFRGKTTTRKKYISKLKKIYYVLLLLSLIGVISDVMPVYRMYGINFYKYSNQIYANRLEGNVQNGIPYLSSLVFVSVSISSLIYIVSGKIKYTIFPLLLIVVNAFGSSGRNGLLYGFIFLVAPITLFLSTKTIKIKHLKKLLLSSFIVGLAFLLLTSNRSSWIETNSYMSNTMKLIVNKRPSFYKNYFYLSSPVGVLNEFLKDYQVDFGKNTFLPFLNLFNKFGFNIEVSAYQEFYYFPLKSNVGSYIREIIQDFGIFFGIIINIFIAFIAGKSYKKSSFNKCSIYYNLLYSIFLTFAFMSFFMLIFRQSFYIIVLFAGVIIEILVGNSIINFNKEEINV